MIWDYADTDQPWITASANEQRADWAEAAVEAFREACAGDNDVSAIYDLIGNLGHLFDRLAATTDMLTTDLMMGAGDFDEPPSFRRAIELALNHYDAERGEGDDIEQAWRQDEED